MTQLQSISGNHISFECQCGYSPQVAVMDLIERHGREMSVNELMRKSKCSVCGEKNKFQWHPPRKLSELGIENPNIERIVAGALSDPSTGGNPIEMTQENTTTLLLEII
jgi:alcohol dehydrogenase class IV